MNIESNVWLTDQIVVEIGWLDESSKNTEECGDDVYVLHVAERRKARHPDQPPNPEYNQQFTEHIQQLWIA